MTPSENDTEVLVEEKDENILVVYAAANGFHIGREDELYTTEYLLGEFPQVSEKWSEAGYIYYNAIEKYKKQTNTDIKVEYFNDTLSMLETAHNEWKNGKGPDVIIGSYTSAEYCLYPYIEAGMFTDLLPYFESDEIYSNGQYISKVLEAGLIDGRQVISPLTFNMNILYTSKERMKEHNIWLSKDMHYEDLLNVFKNGWQEVGNQENFLMLQFTNMDNNYPYILFQSACGEEIIDYETGKITLSKETFEEWLALYQSYICNDYGMTKEELKLIKKDGDSSRYDKLRRSFGNEAINDLFGVLYQKVLFRRGWKL